MTRRGVVVAVAAAALLAGCGDGEEGDAALAPGRAASAWTTYGAAGQPVFGGNAVLVNRGDRDAVLTSVKLVGALPGTGLRAARAAGPKRESGLVAGGEVRRYRQTDVHPLDGMRVPPRQPRGVEVLADLTTGREGRFGYRDLEVTYEVGGREHTVRTGSAFAICLGPRYDVGRTECPRIPVPEPGGG